MITVRTNSHRLIHADAELPKSTTWVVSVEKSVICPRLFFDIYPCTSREEADEVASRFDIHDKSMRGKMIHITPIAQFHKLVEKVYVTRVALEIDAA